MGMLLWIIGGYLTLSVLTVVLHKKLSPFDREDVEDIDVEIGTYIALFAPVMLIMWAMGWLTAGVLGLCRGLGLQKESVY